MLDDLQLLEDAREISHAYFLAMLDWMAHSASLKQRDAISKASTLVRDDPTAENLAKATEIFYELALEAQLLGKLYPELGNEPAFLRVLAKMTVQASILWPAKIISETPTNRRLRSIAPAPTSDLSRASNLVPAPIAEGGKNSRRRI
jgi:hypothetical protein